MGGGFGPGYYRAGLTTLSPLAAESTRMPDLTSGPLAGRTRLPRALMLAGLAMLGPFSVMSLFHGAISDSFGRRPVVLVNLMVFMAATIGCGLAQDFRDLLWFRALQGLSAGAGMVISRAMIRDSFVGHEAQRMIAMVTMIFGLAPAIAPIIGGWLQLAFGWRSVFVFLALFTAVLFACSYWRLSETLPHAALQPFAPRPLTRNYLKLLGSLRFGLLSSAIAFNFAGLFLYISSAPVIVYELLHLNENQFAWLFVPAISGFMFGAFMSGRLAGKLTPHSTIRTGYTVMIVATAFSIVYHAMFPPALPWTVLPVMVYTIGMSLAVPNLTLFVLDLFPHNRGLAASLQAFQQAMFNAIVAGAVSPHVSGTGLGLAATTAVFLTCGAGCAFIYSRLPTRKE